MKNTLLDKEDFMFDNRYLFSLAMPLMADTALSVAVGVADTMMVAQAGEAAVSGVSCMGSIQNLFIYLLMAFATGGSVVASQLLGMKQEERARKSVKILFYLTLSFAIAASSLFLVFKEEIIRSIFGKIEKDVYHSTISYSIPIMISMPAYAIISSANALCRSEGNSKVTMVVSIVVNAVNIIGNAIFLFVFKLGALGVGISSCISRYVGAVIMLMYVTDKDKNRLYLSEPLKFDFDWKCCSLILDQAIPVAIEKSLFHIGKIIISSTIAGFGTATIAAFAVFGNIETVIDIPGTAFSLSSITIIGQCCGGKRYDEATYWSKRILLYSYLLMWCTSSLCFLSIPNIIKLYSLSDEAVAIAVKVIRIDCINRAITWPLAFVLPNILHGAGDAKTVMVVAVLDMWICRVILARILGVNLGLGLLGTQMGMWADWIVRVIVFVPLFASGRWKRKGIAEKESLS